MAGMKRFITYIYAYENTKKAGNTGFARIELRGEECRLEIHLRGVYAAQTHCKIYLFRKQGSGIEGSLIGEMDVRNGAGDFSVIMKTAHISTSLLSFFEMEGIFLCSEDGRIFMSRWTEGEPLTVDMEHFIEWKAEQTEENIYAEENPHAEENMYAEENMHVKENMHAKKICMQKKTYMQKKNNRKIKSRPPNLTGNLTMNSEQPNFQPVISSHSTSGRISGNSF